MDLLLPTLPGNWRLSAYVLDYDQRSRNETLSLHPYQGGSLVMNPGDTIPGSSKTVTNFENGTYVNWVLNGLTPVTIKVLTDPGALNSILSGLFIDPVDANCNLTPGCSSYTLTKTPKNATYNIGDKLSFTMVVTSIGPGTAKNVVLNDPLPTLGSLNSWIITSNPGGCSIASNTLTCSYGNLANGQTRSVTVATNAAGGANAAACPGGVTLNNTATMTATGLPTKTDTGDYTCQPGNLRLSKTPKGATYNLGDNISFQMVVASTGPGTAKNVVLNDSLPTLGNLNS